jgi:hypothetical protein
MRSVDFKTGTGHSIKLQIHSHEHGGQDIVEGAPFNDSLTYKKVVVVMMVVELKRRLQVKQRKFLPPRGIVRRTRQRR